MRPLSAQSELTSFLEEVLVSVTAAGDSVELPLTVWRVFTAHLRVL